MLSAIFAISIGAALGALLRWVLGMGLNSLWPTLPLGTMIQSREIASAALEIGLHVAGSITLTVLGIIIAQPLSSS